MEKERIAFENWMQSDFSYLSLQRDREQPEGYAEDSVDLMFCAWTERAALEEEK